ncbi:CopD family protein [Acetobacteraceae bacterium H6797]|nr:CopD family protein [Acetobacteraceae bacterium H6797]
MLRRLLLLLLLLALSPSGGAWAHAALVESQPADGARAEAAPGEVTLRFDEPITLLDLRLAGPDGVVSLLGQVQGGQISVRLPPGLARGPYLASYRIISADGHPVSGGIAFGIGVDAQPAPTALPDDGFWTRAAEVLRFLLYIGTALGAGGALFGAMVAPLPTGALRAMRLGAALGVIASLLTIGVQGGAMLAAPGPEALLAGETWKAALRSTVFLRSAIIAAGLALVLIGGWRESLIGALLALLGFMVAGHAAVGGLLTQLLLMVHVVTAAFWLGAFLPLALLLRRDGAGALEPLRRFSRLAMPAVALLLASGVAQGFLHLADAQSLLSSEWGQLLLTKGALALMLLGLAALNHRRLTPALAAGEAQTPARLRHSVAAEAALGGAILAVTAVLSMTSPHDAYHVPAAGHHHAPAPRIVTREATAQDLVATLSVSPARVGPNTFTLRLRRPDGQPFASQEVWLDFAQPEAGVTAPGRQMRATAPGSFAYEGAELATAGVWRIRASILVSDFDETGVSFDVTVSR